MSSAWRAAAVFRAKGFYIVDVRLAHVDWTDRNVPDRVEFIDAWNDEQVEYGRALAVVAREAVRHMHFRCRG